MPARIIFLFAGACTMFAVTAGLLLAANPPEPIAARTIAPSDERRGTLEVAWSTDVSVAPAPSRGDAIRALFALCPDGSVLAWQPPGVLHRVVASGAVADRRPIEALDHVRSLDCGDRALLMRLIDGTMTEIVEIEPQTLRERHRSRAGFPGLFPGAGLRLLHGRAWLVGPASDGLLVGRYHDQAWVAVRPINLPPRWRNRPLPTPVGPLSMVQRAADGTLLLVVHDEDAAADYAVIEFDQDGTLHRVRRRASPDAVTGILPRGPRVMGGLTTDPIGAALLPDGMLAVHLPDDRGRADRGRIELVDPTWQTQGYWTVPARGILIGADDSGALYFGDALSTTIRVWKARPPGL